MRRGWNNWVTPRAGKAKNRKLSHQTFAAVAEELLLMPFDEVKTIAEWSDESSIVYLVANQIVDVKEYRTHSTFERLLDRIIGKVKDEIHVTSGTIIEEPVEFEEFCINAGYPKPYEAQVEMMEFGIGERGAKMILGSRGYGKTDYVVILGMAFEIYRDPQMSFLLVTKSSERNAAILAEVAKALRANGVSVERQSSTVVRVEGLKGKDHSVSSVTIGSNSLRGRHPRKVVMDDPVTEDDVSDATRKRVQRVYNEVSKLTEDVLIIGQPVHKFDLYETLRPLLKRIEVPHGTIPELDHDLDAQRMAGISEESIQASYFLKVISETGYPLEKVKFIDDFPPGDSVAFIDPSFEGGDYTALTIIKAHFEGVAVKGRCFKRAWYDCLDDMVKEMEANGVRRICFETNSLGDQPVTMLRDLVDGMGVVGKKSTRNKHSRILQAGAFAPLIHIAKTSDQIYRDQVKKYEYGAKHDDAPDSLASALEWIGLIKGK